MGQKINPKLFRLPITREWNSKWFANKKMFAQFVVQDHKIREFIAKKLKYSSIGEIGIQRASDGRVRLTIYTSRPGVVIGRKGQDLEVLQQSIQKLTGSDVLIDVQEIKTPDLVAKLVAENVALQLERRMSFRRVMKKALQTTMAVGAKGIRIRCSGRLGGAEIARSEDQSEGVVPLHTMRALIDYGFSEANTPYGKIGIKCWVCKAEEVAQLRGKSKFNNRAN